MQKVEVEYRDQTLWVAHFGTSRFLWFWCKDQNTRLLSQTIAYESEDFVWDLNRWSQSCRFWETEVWKSISQLWVFFWNSGGSETWHIDEIGWFLINLFSTSVKFLIQGLTEVFQPLVGEKKEFVNPDALILLALFRNFVLIGLWRKTQSKHFFNGVPWFFFKVSGWDLGEINIFWNWAEKGVTK